MGGCGCGCVAGCGSGAGVEEGWGGEDEAGHFRCHGERDVFLSCGSEAWSRTC